MKKFIAFAGALGALSLASVYAADAPPGTQKDSSAQKSDKKPSGPSVPLETQSVHNAFRLGKKIISGSCPYGDAGFKELAAQGVKTILSVDGARPDEARAKKYGMRYVHIPVSYSGITRAQGLAIARAVKELQGPVFIHCHHGIHRGPTAAVIAAMEVEGWSNTQAAMALAQAGTGENYKGLWANAREWKKATDEEMKTADNSFPSAAKVDDIAGAMVQIDAIGDRMKLVRAADFEVPAEHPDIDPAHEALMLRETFRELVRSPEMGKYSADIKEKMILAEFAAANLENALRDKDKMRAGVAMKAVGATCKPCHMAYRDAVPQ